MEINLKRLQADLVELATLAESDEGIQRVAYSDAFWIANTYVAQKMQAAGMTVRTDGVGNVIGHYPGKSERKITTGSHIDAVPNGGIFDGCLGVMAAIEAVHVLWENKVILNYGIDVVAFAEEEGLVISGLVGSRAYCGLPLLSVMEKRFPAVGITSQEYELAKTEKIPEYSIELHIEQGGILDSEGVAIGIVDGIVAIRRYTVEFLGETNHAGTTPMHLRDDALIKAARFILRVESLVRELDTQMVGTVGQITNEPNGVNVVPGRVCVTLELRAVKEASIQQAYEKLLKEFSNEIAQIELTMEQAAYPMDEVVRGYIGQACQNLGLTKKRMPSGAGHDSMSLAQVSKTGMIFVPSVKGISHSKQEWTRWSDVQNGANILLETLQLIACRC